MESVGAFNFDTSWCSWWFLIQHFLKSTESTHSIGGFYVHLFSPNPCPGFGFTRQDWIWDPGWEVGGFLDNSHKESTSVTLSPASAFPAKKTHMCSDCTVFISCLSQSFARPMMVAAPGPMWIWVLKRVRNWCLGTQKVASETTLRKFSSMSNITTIYLRYLFNKVPFTNKPSCHVSRFLTNSIQFPVSNLGGSLAPEYVYWYSYSAIGSKVHAVNPQGSWLPRLQTAELTTLSARTAGLGARRHGDWGWKARIVEFHCSVGNGYRCRCRGIAFAFVFAFAVVAVVVVVIVFVVLLLLLFGVVVVGVVDHANVWHSIFLLLGDVLQFSMGQHIFRASQHRYDSTDPSVWPHWYHSWKPFIWGYDLHCR